MEDLRYYIGSFIGQVAVNKLSQPRYESIPLIGKKYIIINPFFPECKIMNIKEKFSGIDMSPILIDQME